MRIYTRTGDKGSTALFGGGRVSKDDERVEAYGTVDELNAALGLARAVCSDCTSPGESGDKGGGAATQEDRNSPGGSLAPLADVLARLQQELFDLGADLSDPRVEAGSEKHPPRITDEQVETLEREIDGMGDGLPPLRSFILPGGGEAAARLHLARTIARRAERRTVALGDGVPETAVKYLNRLSDLLFVMARRANAEQGREDILWRG